MADSTIAEYLVRRRQSRRAWLAYLIPGVLLILRACFDSAFDGVTARIVHALSQATGDSVRLMSGAGWLTVALLPLAAVVFTEDRRHRLGRATGAGSDADETGVVHLTARVRADHGHGIAARPISHWLRRLPLLFGFALAVLFWPLTGASMASRWTTTPGGVAFSIGWRVSLATAAVSILVLLFEPWITVPLRRRPRLASMFRRLVVLGLPMLALVVTLIIG